MICRKVLLFASEFLDFKKKIKIVNAASLFVCCCPLPMARPGGVRGAIEYGQPLAGLSRVRARVRILSYPSSESARSKA